MKYTYGFIGCGNMGGALVKAVAQKVQPDKIAVSGYNAEKAGQLADEYNVLVADNVDIASQSEYVFLGVKPQMMAQVLSQLQEIFARRETAPVLVTMAAGLTMESICGMAGMDCPVVRIMPNTPVAIGKGMVLCCRNNMVTDEQFERLTDDMSAAGQLEVMDEKLMDAGSAVSGCGPAFVYMFIEALADGGVKCGLPRAAAQKLAAQTLAGAAELVLTSGKHPGQLKDEVCSPGGSTIEGVRTLEAKGLRGLCIEAVTASYGRTKELGKK